MILAMIIFNDSGDDSCDYSGEVALAMILTVRIGWLVTEVSLF